MTLRCTYCERTYKGNETWDHFIAQSRGGKNSWQNKVRCCSECNKHKANLLPEEWIEKLEASSYYKKDLVISNVHTIIRLKQSLPESALVKASGITGTPQFKRKRVKKPKQDFVLVKITATTFEKKVKKLYPYMYEVFMNANTDLLRWTCDNLVNNPDFNKEAIPRSEKHPKMKNI